MQTQEKRPDNLEELLEYWSNLQNPKNPGKTNNERSATDKANLNRALKDFSVGHQNTEDLSAIHISFLADDITKVQDTLMRGMEQRLGKKPGNQYASSIRSRLNGFIRDVSGLLNSREMRPPPGKYLRKKTRKTASHFSHKNWPPKLTADFENMVANMQDEYYTGPGQEHLLEWKLRLVSLASYKKGANRLVRYMVETERLTDFGLKDLTDYDRIQRYRRHYLGEREKGGHNAFNSMTIAIAAITRYLVIVGQLPCEYEPFSKDKNAPWIKLYRLGTQTLKQGTDTGKTDPLEPKKSLTIEQILDGANLMWKTKPRTCAYKENEYQIFRWYMAATVFRLMVVMPLRQKNWINMTWSENLRQNADGNWEIYFRSHELKNGQSGKLPREYRTILPSFVNAWLEQWRKVLSDTLGPDFEQRCPYVFPGRSREYDAQNNPSWGKMQPSSFYHLVRDICMEVFNQPYNPHHFRHDVATDIMTKPGAGILDATQAAHLLGDNLETVLKKYFKPNTQAKLDNDYFSDLAKKVEGNDKN